MGTVFIIAACRSLSSVIIKREMARGSSHSHSHGHDHGPHDGAAWKQHVLASLAGEGFRAGGARTAVVELLAEQDCCLSAQEIFDRLRGDGRKVGIASVYRTLDQLAQMQLVQRVDVGGGVSRFEAAHPGGDHHHHLVCDDCGRVVAFEDDRLEKELERVGKSLGARVAGHDLVLHGACADCTAA
jgi:Fur family ferric uptake transcriptional regulator